MTEGPRRGMASKGRVEPVFFIDVGSGTFPRMIAFRILAVRTSGGFDGIGPS